MNFKKLLVVLIVISVIIPSFASGEEALPPPAAKVYDQTAKNTYSENDVIAFVYSWFARFDHQVDINLFKKHLDPERVDMMFPDFPITKMEDFERWYTGVVENIQWNSHKLSNITVNGDENSGFAVSLDINWKARTYKGEKYDVNVHQDWEVKVDKNRNFIISRHRATIK